MKKKIKDLIKRYTFRVEWSDEDGVYLAMALELPSVKAHGETPEGALAEVKIPLGLALEMMDQNHEDLPSPIATRKFGGKFLVRATPELHKNLTIQAAEAGVPLNQFLLIKLAQPS